MTIIVLINMLVKVGCMLVDFQPMNLILVLYSLIKIQKKKNHLYSHLFVIMMLIDC